MYWSCQGQKLLDAIREGCIPDMVEQERVEDLRSEMKAAIKVHAMECLQGRRS